MKKLSIVCLASLIFAVSCKENEPSEDPSKMKIQPPTADKIAKNLEMHGDVRDDSYYWLNDRENAEVIDYLERENDYYSKMTAHTDSLKDDLFEEMKGRIKEDDSSVPYYYNGYYYITRFETG
ncbi:MAG: oligopeptidase B, partial [Marinirhabdus sp.]|nr:oligopeptidase B [Marinirhabdus sp.]